MTNQPRRVERGANGIIYRWPPDHDGVQHYGIVFTDVRVGSLDAARQIERTVRHTPHGVEYDRALARRLENEQSSGNAGTLIDAAGVVEPPKGE